MKNALSKALGRAMLRFQELEEVLLEVESFLKNRPLCYMGEEFEPAVITPNVPLRGQPAPYLEENRDEVSDREEKTRRLILSCPTSTPVDFTLSNARRFHSSMENPLGRKGLRYLKTCRDNVRKRWLNEYLHALQERLNSRPEAGHGTTCLKKGSL